MKLLFREFLLCFDAEEQLLRALQLGPIESFLFALDFAVQIFLDTIRQILGNLRLGSAQQKRPDPGRKPFSSERIAFGIIDSTELRAAAENTWHGESHQAP